MSDSNDGGDGESMPNFTTLYFGFASNLSPKTMRQRCPSAMYVGLARLDGWKWIVNSTGYANIIPAAADDVVYGALYFLTGRDESLLDIIESVPWHYQKYKLTVSRVGGDLGDADGQQVVAMTHVDGERLDPGEMISESVVWINKAIDHGLKLGVPAAYMDKYLRPFTPANGDVKEIEMISTGGAAWDVRMTPNVQHKPMPIDVDISKK